MPRVNFITCARCPSNRAARYAVHTQEKHATPQYRSHRIHSNHIAPMCRARSNAEKSRKKRPHPLICIIDKASLTRLERPGGTGVCAGRHGCRCVDTPATRTSDKASTISRNRLGTTHRPWSTRTSDERGREGRTDRGLAVAGFPTVGMFRRHQARHHGAIRVSGRESPGRAADGRRSSPGRTPVGHHRLTPPARPVRVSGSSTWGACAAAPPPRGSPWDAPLTWRRHPTHRPGSGS